MKNTFAKISPFQVDPEKIMETFDIRDDDFSSASSQEKESMVEMHKSVAINLIAIVTSPSGRTPGAGSEPTPCPWWPCSCSCSACSSPS